MRCVRWPFFIGGGRGATAWEWQIWRVHGRFPFWRYMRVGCWPSIGFEADE